MSEKRAYGKFYLVFKVLNKGRATYHYNVIKIPEKDQRTRKACKELNALVLLVLLIMLAAETSTLINML